MADIAPLGFAVDTKPLADAAAAAQDARLKIVGVADAAYQVAEASDKSASAVRKAADAHRDHAKAVDQHTAAVVNLKQKSDQVGTSTLQNAQAELATRQRIHDMVDASLRKQAEAARYGPGGFIGSTVPKNPAASAFTHQIAADAARRMGPTDADVARTAKAAKEASSFRKELEGIALVADPTSAKLLKLNRITEQLGKAFDAKKITPQQYQQYLAGLDRQYGALEHPGPSGAARHNTFLGEAGRAFTYGIPRFGREARRLVYSAENEEPGGALGGGLGGFAMLAAGAGTGMIAVQLFRTISQIPGEIAKSEDGLEMLQRKLTSFDAGGLSDVRNLAEGLYASLDQAASALVSFHNAFSNIAADRATQDKAFGAAMSAGRVSGLDEKGQEQLAGDVAKTVQKPIVSSADIQSLSGQSPNLVNAAAQQMGYGSAAALQIAAQAGNVSGKALLDAIVSVSATLKSQSDRLKPTSDELNNQINTEFSKMTHNMGVNLLGWFRGNVELPFARYLAGDTHIAGPATGPFAAMAYLFGGNRAAAPAATTGSTTVKLPDATPASVSAADRVSAVLNETSSFGTASLQAKEYATQLKDLQLVLAAVGAHGAGADQLRARIAAVKEAMADTPFGKITEQVNDLTEALGKGGGSSSLVGVWEQAIQIEREQEKQGLATAASLGQIVQQLIALKRAQQALADEDELKKLQQSIDTTAAKSGALGLGSYEQKVRAHDVEMGYFSSQHEELGAGGGAAGAPSVTATGKAGFSRYGTDAYAYFKSLFGDSVARGIGAGVTAEGGSLGMAANGAFGIGQWRGARQGELMRRYGMNPSEAQQFAYMAYELHGGDAGGRSVTSAGDSKTAAENYIRNFMRPGPGTSGDLRRVYAALGMHGAVPVGTGAGGSAPNLLNPLLTKKDADFFSGLDFESASTLSGLVGNPSAFMASGAISGGSIARTSAQLGAFRSGGTPADVHNAELEAKIADEVKSLAPSYRDAYAAALRLEDVGQQRLQSEQKVAQLNQEAADNARRATTAAIANPRQMALLELQLKVEEVRRQPLPQDEQDRQIAALQNDAHGQALRDTSSISGTYQKQNADLRDQLSLTKYVGTELKLQQALLKAKNDLEDHAGTMSVAELQNAEDYTAQLIIQNEQLQKKLDFVDTLTGSFDNATKTIGDGWEKMLEHMEQHGGVHFKTIVKSAEDAFFGMLNELEQKLVMSPLMNVLDQLFSRLTGSLFGASAGIPAPNVGADAGVNISTSSLVPPSAYGNIFGPRGMMAFALGGTGIFNTPTRFAMGGGAGIAGEGPGTYEGILPLRRGSDGKLGVSASGGGGSNQTTVNVIDQRGSAAAAVEVQDRQTGNGKRQIDVFVRDQQRQNITSGKVDADMRSSYGINRPAARR